MKPEAALSANSVSQTLARGTCPICAVLKDYQWTLATTAQPSTDLRLCNFHCWSLARSRGSGLSRSTPGETATGVFLEMIREPLIGKVPSEDCDLCRRVSNEEMGRLRELGKKFQSTVFSQWMASQGTLCVDHGRKLKEFVPLKFGKVIDDIIGRTRAELQEELERFREQLKHGNHEGGGLLGRVAEFLVGQRGL
jgi:hypothetical protein